MLKLILFILLVTKLANLTDPSFYEVLGVSKDSTQQEIRQAYKKLAVKLHPDKNPNEEEKFLKITEAYETLKDSEKRRKYDLYGHYPSYTRQYDSKSQAEYNKLFYNGLYHDDEFVDTLTAKTFQSYVTEGFHFINFYSPFCPPCQSLCDHWKKLAQIYKDIIKVGAVNCKYHNSFCYNVMRINSYPTLLFYPNGKSGGYVYYSGDRSFASLERLVVQYLRKRVQHAYTARRASGTVLYLLGDWTDEERLRIAFKMKHIVSVLSVSDSSFRQSLVADADLVTVSAVLQLPERDVALHSLQEHALVQECLQQLPSVQEVDPQHLQSIRNKLRNGGSRPFVLYFSSAQQSKLPLLNIKHTYPELDFGTMDCDKWSQLCSSLQAEVTPAWGVLKPGGGYQSAAGRDVTAFLQSAPWVHNLHSLSVAETKRVLEGEEGVWLLAIIPYRAARDTVDEAFTATCQHYADVLQCGVVSCSSGDSSWCRQLAGEHPALLLQNNTHRHTYVGRYAHTDIIRFVQLLRYNPVVKLNAESLLEVLNHKMREKSWAVAFFPADCALLCEQLAHQWRILADRLRPLSAWITVGVVECTREYISFCSNIRSSTARVYPLYSTLSYVSNLQQLSEWSYMSEWALQYLLPPQGPAPRPVSAPPPGPARLTAPDFTTLVLSNSDRKPWLIYFHSPRCHHCYEMYADFIITATLLKSALNAGQVNCLSERSLCQKEQITSYPSLRLYLAATRARAFSTVLAVPVTHHDTVIQTIRTHLVEYDQSLLVGVDKWGLEQQSFHIKHDEF